MVYFYIIDGLIIDTGHRLGKKSIERHLRKHHIDQSFITHHHEDHSGNVDLIRDLYNCPVYASSRCCELMKNPPPISLAQKITWGDRPSADFLLPVDDQIKSENYAYQIIPIPGHAEDMVGLYEEEQGWFFSADLYINDYIGYFVYNEDIYLQIDSLKRVLQLNFDKLFCCHQPRLEDPKKYLKSKLQFLEDFSGEVERHYNQGLTAREIHKKMKLKENWPIRILSGNQLSSMHRIHSVIRNLKNG